MNNTTKKEIVAEMNPGNTDKEDNAEQRRSFKFKESELYNK